MGICSRSIGRGAVEMNMLPIILIANTAFAVLVVSMFYLFIIRRHKNEIDELVRELSYKDNDINEHKRQIQALERELNNICVMYEQQSPEKIEKVKKEPKNSVESNIMTVQVPKGAAVEIKYLDETNNYKKDKEVNILTDKPPITAPKPVEIPKPVEPPKPPPVDDECKKTTEITDDYNKVLRKEKQLFVFKRTYNTANFGLKTKKTGSYHNYKLSEFSFFSEPDEATMILVRVSDNEVLVFPKSETVNSIYKDRFHNDGISFFYDDVAWSEQYPTIIEPAKVYLPSGQNDLEGVTFSPGKLS